MDYGLMGGEDDGEEAAQMKKPGKSMAPEDGKLNALIVALKAKFGEENLMQLLSALALSPPQPQMPPKMPTQGAPMGGDPPAPQGFGLMG